MAEFPALPLWTDAWVADTHHLTREQRGTYHDLLVLMWRTPGCRVPNDDKWLAAHLHMTLEEVRNELHPLVDELCMKDGNYIAQKRLIREMEFVRKNSARQSVRAKGRWQKEKSDATAMRVRNAPTPTKEQESKKEASNGSLPPGRGIPPAAPALEIDNLQKFMIRIATELDRHTGGRGWSIVGAASNRDDPTHARCLLICKNAAQGIGKGWPFNWPTDGKMFDGMAQQINGAVSHETKA